MFEATDEHSPESWVRGLLGVIADQLADSRRGVLVDAGSVVQVVRQTDDGDSIVLTLTFDLQAG
jgi:hypothetical protein